MTGCILRWKIFEKFSREWWFLCNTKTNAKTKYFKFYDCSHMTKIRYSMHSILIRSERNGLEFLWIKISFHIPKKFVIHSSLMVFFFHYYLHYHFYDSIFADQLFLFPVSELKNVNNMTYCIIEIFNDNRNNIPAEYKPEKFSFSIKDGLLRTSKHRTASNSWYRRKYDLKN